MNKVSDLNPLNSLDNVKDELYNFNYPLISDYVEEFEVHKVNDIYKKIKNTSIDFPNVRADFFREGKNYNDSLSSDAKKLIEADINQLDQLNLSMRVSNFQLIDKKIKKITTLLSTQLNQPVTCNMYLTPSAQGNCFTYHIDEQHSIIAQLSGSKEWFFPRDAQSSFIKKLEMRDVKEIEESNIYSLLVQTGDIFVIGPNLVHKAQLNGMDMSIHLTFAILKKNNFNITQYLFEILKDSFIQQDFHTKSINTAEDLDDLKQRIIKDIENINSSEQIKKIKKAKLVDEVRILKKGRHY